MTRFGNLRFRTRLVLLVTAAATMIGAAATLATYHQVTRTAFASASHRLDTSSQLHSDHLRAILRLVRADAAALSEMPPIGGIIRSSRAADQIDPHDGSGLPMWRARLEQIFAATLDSRPYYTQIRFIGRADDWRELVRTNARPDGFESVPRRAAVEGRRTLPAGHRRPAGRSRLFLAADLQPGTRHDRRPADDPPCPPGLRRRRQTVRRHRHQCGFRRPAERVGDQAARRYRGGRAHG
ncbi:hypothetical protein [Pseudooceanicola sp. LIPI14-2-Ac024]|uniref:hypothetical protein n=1 Tax=Pseudooceanicola sp. LIPI14-2-Ac024 TaxID=3344875 RepID=UPI0035D07F78